MITKALDYLIEGNFKDFKDTVNEILFNRISCRLQEVKEEIASDFFYEESIELVSEEFTHSFLNAGDHKILSKEKDTYGQAYALGQRHGYLGSKKLSKSQTKHLWPQEHVGHHDAYLEGHISGKSFYKNESVENLEEISKETLTSYTKKASKELADRSRNFINPSETDYNEIVNKASKIGNRLIGIEKAQNKLAAGEYDPERASKVTMQAKYKPKRVSKVSSKTMKELTPDYSTDNKRVVDKSKPF